MNFEEFLQPRESAAPNRASIPSISKEEVDIQKAVVEDLAAEKAELEEEMNHLRDKNVELEKRIQELEAAVSERDGKIAALEEAQKAKGAEMSALEAELADRGKICTEVKAQLERVQAELAETQAKEMDIQERNPNALALLDRDVDLPDRFPGETRDQVLAVVREARDKAEAEGRIRRAQVLEGVLVANEPNGNLDKKRAALEKFFADNGNIITGKVMEALDKSGISYKKGEEYLMPSEILLRTY